MQDSRTSDKSRTCPILDHLSKHRSIRRYKTDLISDEIIDRIIKASTSASTSGNMQAYSVIVTSDIDIKKQLDKAHFSQSMLHDAPVLLTFCADFHRMRRWIELSDAPMNFDNFFSFMIGAIDAVLASQNAAIAAEAEGLGICYLGTTLASCYEISSILKCPIGVVPVVGFAMGYPNECPPLRDRLPTESIAHKEIYRYRSDCEILEAYRMKESKGWERYMNDRDLRDAIRKGKAENLAQVYTKIKYTRESHLQYSHDVLSCLRKQGFEITF